MVAGMADTERRNPAQQTVRRGLPRAFVGLAAVLCLAAVGLVVGRTMTDSGTDCTAVGARVAGLEGFGWDNGITSSGSEWASVLTDGVTEADDPSRHEIARAVQSDEAGYQRFRGELSDDAAVAADRLRQVAGDPAAGNAADSQQIEQDSDVLRRHALDECGLV